MKHLTALNLILAVNALGFGWSAGNPVAIAFGGFCLFCFVMAMAERTRT